MPRAIPMSASVQGELFASFGKAMILGLMLMLTVLILLFKSSSDAAPS
jgi:multidrug efflux pump subunit AcrB